MKNYLEVKRVKSHERNFDMWITSEMFIDVHTEKYIFSNHLQPSRIGQWEKRRMNYFWGWNELHTPLQINRDSHHTKNLKCHRFVGTTLPKKTEVKPQINYFGWFWGPKHPQNSTIFESMVRVLTPKGVWMGWGTQIWAWEFEPIITKCVFLKGGVCMFHHLTCQLTAAWSPK